jgi:hypothetical protein
MPNPSFGVRCIALGLLAPALLAILTLPLWLFGAQNLLDYVYPAALPISLAGLALVLVGLASLAIHRTRRDPATAREADAALDEALDEDAKADGPTVLLDAPTGLPWERR